MRHLSFALLAFLGLAVACDRASAVDITRICTAVYDVNTGALNCNDAGWQPKLLSGLSTTVTSVRSSNEAQLSEVYCYNPNASVAYIQLFDAATAASVTLGTTVPKLSFGIAATSGQAPLNLAALGVHFANGIQAAVTTTATGSTAPGSAMDCNATFN